MILGLGKVSTHPQQVRFTFMRLGHVIGCRTKDTRMTGSGSKGSEHERLAGESQSQEPCPEGTISRVIKMKHFTDST